MAIESLGEGVGRAAVREPPDRVRALDVFGVGGASPKALLESQARHPSSARYPEAPREVPCSKCGWRSTTVVDAVDVVRRLAVLASHLLHEDAEQHHDRPSSELTSRLQRVARLRDELHVTANRVARFGDEENPFLDPVRITAPIASSAVLAPAHLLFQLDLTAARLVGHLDALSAADWTRTGRMGDRVVTLGGLVGDVVHTSTHDLLDLLHAAPVCAPEGVTLLDDGRTRRDRRDSLRSTYSPIRQGPRDVTAS